MEQVYIVKYIVLEVRKWSRVIGSIYSFGSTQIRDGPWLPWSSVASLRPACPQEQHCYHGHSTVRWQCCE